MDATSSNGENIIDRRMLRRNSVLIVLRLKLQSMLLSLAH
jgi:hypothetical protein